MTKKEIFLFNLIGTILAMILIFICCFIAAKLELVISLIDPQMIILSIIFSAITTFLKRKEC